MLTAIDYPAVCPAPTHIEVCAPWRGAPSGYDFSAVCDPPFGVDLNVPSGCDGNETIADEYFDECADARSQSATVVLLWVTVALYMFYGMALVCEEFMVPALNLFCIRHSIPSNVAGATLLAAGCNAPELIASAISIFVTRSTVGAGTVIGSAPFNILFICGASAIAVGGIDIDQWLLAREVVALLASLAMLLWVLSDNMVQWWQALLLVLGFVGYVIVCVRWEEIVSAISPSPAPPEGYRSIKTAAEIDTAKLIVPSSMDEPTAEWTRALATAAARVRGAGTVPGSRGKKEAAAEVALGRMRGMLLKRNPFYMPAATARAAHRAWQARYFVLEAGERPLRYMRLSSSGAPDASSATRIDLACAVSVELHPSGTGSQLTIITRTRAAPRSEASWSTSTGDVPMSPTTPLSPGLQAASLLAGAALGSPKQIPRSDTAPLPRFREGTPIVVGGGLAGGGIPTLEMPSQMIVAVDAPPAIPTDLRPGSAPRQHEGEGLGVSLTSDAAVTQPGSRLAVGRRSADDVFTRQRQAALRSRWLPTSSSWSFQTAAAETEHVHELRLLPDVDATELSLWRDQILLNIEQLRHDASHTPTGVALWQSSSEVPYSEEDDEEEEIERWYVPPAGWRGRLLFIATLPLAAAVHCTTPNVQEKHRRDAHLLTLGISLGWLVVLATTMASILDQLGCYIGFSSTVMGLTLGAVGTSFPNLYASVVTARQGLPNVAVSQALASNVFNVQIALGLMWLVQTTVGACIYGPDVNGPVLSWCAGCFMPSGLSMSCPHVAGRSQLPVTPGSLFGTIVFSAACTLLLAAVVSLSHGRLTVSQGVCFCISYLLYAAYQVLAQRETFPTLCVWGSCL